MAYSNGYIFDTEADAQAAIDAINTAMGIPVDDDALTRTFTSYSEWGNVWAIIYTPELGPILGQPQVLPELPDPDPIDP
jgi:hypothetical protein